VEIDESKFTNHTKGGRSTKLWVLGFYERGTRDVRAVVIKDRTEQTLTQVIREHCEEGAELYTDFWRGYNGLKHYFKHRIVNKARKGKGTNEFCTTNRVESFWSHLKSIVFNYHMVHGSTLQKYLDEAIWRIKCRTKEERVDYLCQILRC